MSLIKRGLIVLRDEGPVIFFKRTLSYLSSKSGISSGGYDYGSYPDYQKDRKTGNKIRWEMITPYITTDSSVLDVGCNAGEMTARAAKQGAFSIGIDVRPDTIARAKEENGSEENIAFVHSEVTLDNIPSLPRFDTIFLLSVYHQWHKIYGSKTSSEMLRGLAKKCNENFFFEAAGQKSKYGDDSLPFDDFDEESIVKYNKEFLNRELGEQFNIEYLGSTPRREGYEGERYMFHLTRK